MPLRRLLLGWVCVFGLGLAVAPSVGLAATTSGPDPIYLNRSYTPQERAADLVSRMTLAEKASQMVSSQSPAIPRLHVNAWGWWNESNHGVADLQLAPGYNNQAVNTTTYPDDLALGSSWDPSLMYQEATAISDEAREVAPYNSLDLDYFAPTVNLSRDPRWGRNDETFSEDPLLTATMAAQYVDGLQGETPEGTPLPQGGGYLKAIATLKHYAANNSENDRMTGSSNVSTDALHDYYTSQFNQIIGASHPGAMMSAFNEVNGTPSSANTQLIDTLARETFGFDGYFTSDCDSIDDIVYGHGWVPPGYTRPLNETEARAFANAAGEDLNCNLPYTAYNYQNTLAAATTEGIRTQTDTYNVNDMDTSLVRLFTARIELGDFSNPGLDPWVKQARSELGGAHWVNSNANNAETETPARLSLDQSVADRTQVLLKNATITRRDGTVGQVLPIRVPSSGPFKVAVIGYFANNMYLGGYSSYQAAAGAAHDVTPYAGIRDEILGIDPQAQVDYLPGFIGGTNASTLTTIDPAAVAAAAGYNDVIVVVGTDYTTSNEGLDRTSLALPGAQAQLIDEVAAKNPNTVAVMVTVGAVNVGSFAGSVPAMLWSSYNGQREGLALADVLLGYYNPSGHLPFTWYTNESELPPIDDYSLKGRTYMYFSGPVSYPFGYGLSYTTFATSDLRLSKTHLTPNDTFDASVNVTNTGSAPGEDLVQLYVTKPGQQYPIKRLEAFQQVELAPGQTKTVTLAVKVLSLAFWDSAANKYVVEHGLYGVQIGSSADDVLADGYVGVEGNLIETPKSVTASPTMPGDAARGIQQRVMFPEDETVLPNLTVSMNDDALYGHIAGERGRPLPRGATVTFTSDHPDVVSVVNGKLQTVANGVATITATVTDHGVSASGRFVVRVLSELSGISLRLTTPNRKTHTTKAKNKKHKRPTSAVTTVPLPGFEPDTYTYNVIVPDTSKVPRISATTPDKHARVQIAQAAGAPGTAKVTITGPDGITLTYAIYFAHPAKSQSFDGTSVGPQWTWIGQNPATETVGHGSLQITAERGDLSGTAGPPHNLLVQPARGNWTINSRMTFSALPLLPTQQGGIIAYQDAQNWLKLDLEYTPTGPQLVETSENNLSGAPVSEVLAVYPIRTRGVLWLRMVKRGPRYTSYFSTDGRHFTPIYNTGASLTDVSVGLFAFGGASTSTNMKVSFAYFHVTNTGPVNLQSLH